MHRKNIFPKINSKNYKFSAFFTARYPVPAMPEPEYKFLVPVLLTPYLFCCLNSNKKWNKYVYVSLVVEDPSLNLKIK